MHDAAPLDNHAPRGATRGLPAAPAGEPDRDYRTDFYDRYRSTHVGPRKGEATLDGHRRRFGKWDRVIGPHLPESKQARIVDCGCGSGPIVAWLVERGYSNAMGIDGSPEEVAAARALGLPVERAELVDFLGTRAASFDLVILRNVIEHFHKPEIVEILRATRESLRPGGRVFIQVPNAEALFGARLRYADFTHEIAFTRSSIAQVLRVCRFDEVRVGALPPGFRGWRGLLWRAVERFYRAMLYAELGKTECILTQDLFAVATRAAPERADAPGRAP